MVHKTQMGFLMMSCYKQEMKQMKGDLEWEKKVGERPRFKHAKVVTN
jgi:hypothetical protein